MTIKQQFLTVQREINKLTKQINKITTTIGKMEAKKAVMPKIKYQWRKKPLSKDSQEKLFQKKTTKATDYGKVLDLIKASKDGIGTKSLMHQTWFNTKKIANIIYKGTKSGQIKTIWRGVCAAVYLSRLSHIPEVSCGGKSFKNNSRIENDQQNRACPTCGAIL